MTMGYSDAKDGIRQYFDSFATRYDATTVWRHDQKLLGWFERHMISVHAALDLGCGTGIVGEVACRFAEITIGVDISSAMLKHAKTRGLKIVRADAESLPFKDALFDMVVCRQLIHYADPRACLFEVHRVLKKGGLFLLGQATSHGEEDLHWWQKLKEVTQPLRKIVFSPNILANSILDASLDRQETCQILLRREDSIDTLLSESSLPIEKRREWLSRMIADTNPQIARRLGLELRGTMLHYLQAWTLVRAKNR